MLKINLTQVNGTTVDLPDQELTKIVEDFKQRETEGMEGDAKEIYTEIKESLRPHFPTEDFNEMQLSAVMDAVVSYVQVRIAERLDEIFPDEFYARLDTYLDDETITPEQVPAIIDYMYTTFTNGSIVEFGRSQALEYLPYLKAELKKYKRQLQDLVNLDPEKQQQFISLVAKDDFAAAADLLSS